MSSSAALQTALAMKPKSPAYRRAFERAIASIRSDPTPVEVLHFTPEAAADKLWRYLPLRRATRHPKRARRSKDRIKHKTHISERSEAANTRKEAEHWEADLVICKRARPVLVLHERKTRLTLMARLSGKTAGETISAIMTIFKRLSPEMRRSATFDNGAEFSEHALLRGVLSATT